MTIQLVELPGICWHMCMKTLVGRVGNVNFCVSQRVHVYHVLLHMDVSYRKGVKLQSDAKRSTQGQC